MFCVFENIHTQIKPLFRFLSAQFCFIFFNKTKFYSMERCVETATHNRRRPITQKHNFLAILSRPIEFMAGVSFEVHQFA